MTDRVPNEVAEGFADRSLAVREKQRLAGAVFPETQKEEVYTLVEMIAGIRDVKDQARDLVMSIDRVRGIEMMTGTFDMIVGGVDEYIRRWTGVLLYSLSLARRYAGSADLRPREQGIQAEMGMRGPSLSAAVGILGDNAIMEAISCAVRGLSCVASDPDDETRGAFAEWMTGVASVASWAIEDVGDDWVNRCHMMLVAEESGRFLAWGAGRETD